MSTARELITTIVEPTKQISVMPTEFKLRTTIGLGASFEKEADEQRWVVLINDLFEHLKRGALRADIAGGFMLGKPKKLLLKLEVKEAFEDE